jgi:ABC-2 type transport system ATP-binding protein
MSAAEGQAAVAAHGPADALIRVENLHKSFGDTHAVNGVSLHVRAGEIYGLVGPDGSGKTTLIRLLCGALRADVGDAWIVGNSVATNAPLARENIGYLAQRFSLYEELSVSENLQFFAEVRGLPREQYQARSAEILDFVGLSQFVDRRAGQLSGGMKQKLGLALALVNEPRVLLLDEPTTGVDPVTRQDFWKLIAPLLREGNISVFVSTPYMDEAVRCTRVGFLRHGQLIREGPPHALQQMLSGRILLLTGQPRPLLAEIARADPAVEAIQRFGNQLHIRLRKPSSAQVVARLTGAITAAGGAVQSLHEVEPQLEDVFLALTDNEVARVPGD